MKAATHLLIVLCGFALLTGCGTPGAPMPPSLELPRAPLDLTATRKGDKVTLSWTAPTQTTDGTTVRAKYAGPTLICRGVSATPLVGCAQRVAQVAASVKPAAKGQNTPPAVKIAYTDAVPADLQAQHPAGFAQYAVEVTNSRGRSAGLSNQVKIPLAPTLPAPSDVRARVTAEGVKVVFTVQQPPSLPDTSFHPRLRRTTEGTNVPPVVLNSELSVQQGGTVEVADHSIEWEKTYLYQICVVTTLAANGQSFEVEGDDSPAVKVVAHDVFPPAVPQGLEAVASGVGQSAFVDLTWIPGTEPDLAGYNVYRQEQGSQAWVKLNATPAATPSFRDETVVRGKAYAYAVSAVDVRGNESGRSQVANESVP